MASSVSGGCDRVGVARAVYVPVAVGVHVSVGRDERVAVGEGGVAVRVLLRVAFGARLGATLSDGVAAPGGVPASESPNQGTRFCIYTSTCSCSTGRAGIRDGTHTGGDHDAHAGPVTLCIHVPQGPLGDAARECRFPRCVGRCI